MITGVFAQLGAAFECLRLASGCDISAEKDPRTGMWKLVGNAPPHFTETWKDFAAYGARNLGFAGDREDAWQWWLDRLYSRQVRAQKRSGSVKA